jgi:hypothetical protein
MLVAMVGDFGVANHERSPAASYMDRTADRTVLDESGRSLDPMADASTAAVWGEREHAPDTHVTGGVSPVLSSFLSRPQQFFVILIG